MKSMPLSGRPIAAGLCRQPLKSTGLSYVAPTFRRTDRSTFLPSCRHASSSHPPSLSTSRPPLMMPGNMPREDYAAPAMYTLSYLGRIVRFLLFGTAGLAAISFASFEGLHYYIEHVSMAIPSRSPMDGDGDEFAWQSENQGWTGGAKGGTDPRLGWKARHALRGAWICQEWGAGAAPGAIGKTSGGGGGGGGMHPEFGGKNTRGMMGSKINKIDRGYELAEEYVDVAISQAKIRGLVFPPNLPTIREPGPSSLSSSTSSFPQGDPAAIDLLLIKAGILERISTPDAIHQAKDLYEQVLASISRTTHPQDPPASRARIIRLAGKVGDMCSRVGEGAEAVDWWAWGLNRAGVEMPSSNLIQELKEIKQEVKGWFGTRRTKVDPSTTVPETPSTPVTPSLPPPVLRAAVNLSISSSAYFATTASQLHLAAALQAQAITLLPSISSNTRIPTPSPSSASASLHSTWLRHRAALVHLHAASVAHARGTTTVSEPLQQVTSASTAAETIVTALNPLPTAYSSPRNNPLITAATLLKRDSLLLAAEASYTRGLLIEHSLRSAKSSSRIPKSTSSDENQLASLELAAECFERSMALSLMEAGDAKSRAVSTGGVEIEEGAGRGEDWARYYRGFARVRGKIDELADGMIADGATHSVV